MSGCRGTGTEELRLTAKVWFWEGNENVLKLTVMSALLYKDTESH